MSDSASLLQPSRGGAESKKKKQRQLERWAEPDGRQSKLECGNDNKARHNVIIFLPNRSEPKTTARATGMKTVLGTPRSVKASHGKNWNHQWPSAGQDGSVAIGGPAVIGDSSTHLLHTSLNKNTGNPTDATDFERSPNTPLSHSKSPNKQSTFFPNSSDEERTSDKNLNYTLQGNHNF